MYAEIESYYEDQLVEIPSSRVLKNVVFLNGKENQIRLEVGLNVFTEGTYSSEMFIYSQPNRFFRLPGRLNFEAGAVTSSSSYNFLIAGISEDIMLPLVVSSNGSLYVGVGIGLYIKSATDDRIGSALTFGERLFFGYSYDSWSLEWYIKHYSNGSIERPNGGHNFSGLTLGYSF